MELHAHGSKSRAGYRRKMEKKEGREREKGKKGAWKFCRTEVEEGSVKNVRGVGGGWRAVSARGETVEEF